MKRILFIFAALAQLATLGYSQVPTVTEATAAQVTAGTVGPGYYVSPRRLAGAPVSTEVAAALALKANANNAVFTGTVTVPDGALSISDTSGLQTALDGKQRVELVKSANFTAVAGESYVITASATVTDPASPVNGQSYAVRVSAGTATVGAVGYALKDLVITRSYNSGSWSNTTISNDLSYQQRSIRTPRFTINCAKINSATAAIARLAIFGDSYGIECFSQERMSDLIAAYGFRGAWSGVAVQFGIAEYTEYGGVTDSVEYNHSLSGGSWALTSSGHGIGFRVSAAYQAVVNKATIVYGKSVGAGTFKVQTQLNGGSWVDVTTIDCSNASTTNGAYELALTPYQVFRCLWISGSSVIVGALLEDTTATSGIVISYIARGGLDLTGGVNTVPAASLAAQLAVIAPDLVTVTFADEDITTSYPIFLSNWRAALSTVEFLLIAPHNSQSLAASRIRNDQIINIAKANSSYCDYFDLLDFIPSYTWASDRGLMANAGHLNSFGYAFAENVLFAGPLRAILPPIRSASNAEQNAGTSRSVFSNPNTVLLSVMDRIRVNIIPDSAVSNVSGSAWGYISGTNVVYTETGTTAGAGSYSVVGPNAVGNQSPIRLNYGNTLAFSLDVLPTSLTTNGVLRINMGDTVSLSQLATPGFGMEIRNSRVWIIAYSGTTFSEFDTGYDVGISKAFRFYCQCSGGIVSLFQDGTQIGQVGGAPSSGIEVAFFRIANTNGADSANHGFQFGRAMNFHF